MLRVTRLKPRLCGDSACKFFGTKGGIPGKGEGEGGHPTAVLFTGRLEVIWPHSMLRQLGSRVLYTLPVIWLVVSIVFLLIHLVPGDPIVQMLGEGAASTDIEAARHAYGLDVPLGQQYANYWKGVLHGNLGPSIRFNQGVTQLLAARYPFT